MRTSPIGRRSNSGFTFLELALVLVLLGLALFLAVPPLQEVSSGGKLEKAARKLAAVIRHARGLAAATGTPHLLTLDVKKGLYWIGPEISRKEPVGDDQMDILEQHALPSSIKFKDVETAGQGLVMEGAASIHFWANGLVETSTIHLRDDRNRDVTLIPNPLTGSVEVVKKYVVQKDQ
jgi:Tfp pilus assembly protein FimT